MRTLLILMMCALTLVAFSLPAVADACHEESSHDCCETENSCDADCDNSQHDDDGCSGPGCDGCFLPCCSGLLCLKASGTELAPGDASLAGDDDSVRRIPAADPSGIDHPPRA